MGLDTTHDCWHGAYSAFYRWRNTIAQAAGYKLRGPTAEERQAGYYTDVVDIDWSVFKLEHFQGEWGDFVPGDDPLLYLIVHSDCDGVIHPQQGRHLADRLEQLLPLLDDTTAIGHIHPSMRAKTEEFIKGLRKAAIAEEDVEFW